MLAAVLRVWEAYLVFALADEEMLGYQCHHWCDVILCLKAEVIGGILNCVHACCHFLSAMQPSAELIFFFM